MERNKGISSLSVGKLLRQWLSPMPQLLVGSKKPYCGQHQGLRQHHQKAAASCAASQGFSIGTIIEAGDWTHTFMMYGHYISSLPREVLVRILEWPLANIQGVNVVAVTRANMH